MCSMYSTSLQKSCKDIQYSLKHPKLAYTRTFLLNLQLIVSLTMPSYTRCIGYPVVETLSSTSLKSLFVMYSMRESLVPLKNPRTIFIACQLLSPVTCMNLKCMHIVKEISGHVFWQMSKGFHCAFKSAWFNFHIVGLYV